MHYTLTYSGEDEPAEATVEVIAVRGVVLIHRDDDDVVECVNPLLVDDDELWNG